MKPVRLSGHARERIQQRGATEAEVVEVISSCQWTPAELGKLECKKDFPFEKEWNKRYYISRQIRPIFVEEASEIVVVTVYVYYF